MDRDAREGYKRNWTPGFFVQQKPDGYALGLRVPEWWWDEAKSSCPSPMKEEKDYACGQVELTLTYVSYREFDLYMQPSNWNDLISSGDSDKIVKRLIAKRDEQRAKFKWKCVTKENDPELRIDWPEAIDHKYLTVGHNEI